MADKNTRRGRSIGAASTGEGRAGIGRPKGKGYAMGNKRQITLMIGDPMLDEVDEAALALGVARSVLISIAIREYLDRKKAAKAE